MEFKNKNIYLVDFSYHLYRSHHALFDLCVTYEDGTIQPTGHIVGVLNFLTNLYEQDKDGIIILCLDGYPIERKKLCEKAGIGYKENRAKSSYNIKIDTAVICDLAQYIPNVYICEDELQESDDLMFTLSRVLDQSNNFFICTVDKDLLQSLNENTKIFKGFGDIVDVSEYSTRESYLKNFKATDPTKLPIFRALCGDASDNIKGISRMPKDIAKIVAESLVNGDEFSNVYNICKDKVKPTRHKWLQAIEDDCIRLNYNYQVMKLNISTDYTLTRELVPIKDVVNTLELNKFKSFLTKHKINLI